MGGARVPTPQAHLDRARALQLQRRLSLRDLRDVLAKEGITISIKTLSVAGLAVENLPPPEVKPAPAGLAPSSAANAPPPPPAVPGALDADGTPISIAREMLRAITGQMALTEKDSGPYVRLSGEARQLTKLIAALEREAAGEETPEERERRLRREDGETVHAIDRYVNQALAEALKPSATAPHGRCPTCEQPLTAEARAALGA